MILRNIEVLDTPGAPAGAKTLARHLKAGTKPYQLGHPLDIRFTALDGREVDLARLKGKVVLIEFWSTTCGPCIGEMPEVKAVYDQHHSEGFEIIGISLDDKKKELRERAGRLKRYRVVKQGDSSLSFYGTDG